MATAKEQLLSMMNPQAARLMDQQLRQKQVAQRAQGAGMLSGLVQAYTGMGDVAQRATGIMPMGATEQEVLRRQDVQKNNKEMLQKIAKASKSTDVVELSQIRDELSANPTTSSLKYVEAIQKKIDALNLESKKQQTATKVSEYMPYLREDFQDIEVIRAKRNELDTSTNPTLIALADKLDKKISNLNKKDIQIVDGVAVDKNKLTHNDIVSTPQLKPVLTDTQLQGYVADGTFTALEASQLRGETDQSKVYSALETAVRKNATASKNPTVKEASKIVTDAIDEQLFIESPKILAKAQELARRGDIENLQVLLNQQEKLKSEMERKKAEASKAQPKAKAVTLNPYSTKDAIYVDTVEDKLKNISEENPHYEKLVKLGMLPVVEYSDGFFGDNMDEFAESFLNRQELTYNFKAFLSNNPGMTFQEAYQKAFDRVVLGKDIGYLSGTTSTTSTNSSESDSRYSSDKQVIR